MSSKTSATTVLTATLAVQSLVAMCLLTLPAVAPAVADSLGISPTYLGLYIAFAYLGAIASSLLAGVFVRRFVPLRYIQIGLLLFPAGVAISVLPSPLSIAIGAVLIFLVLVPLHP